MSRAIATLLFLVAITGWGAPSWFTEVGAAEPPRRQRTAQKKKARPRPAKPRATPSVATTRPTPALTPRPLQSEAGPSESDVARLARVRAKREAVEAAEEVSQRLEEAELASAQHRRLANASRRCPLQLGQSGL